MKTLDRPLRNVVSTHKRTHDFWGNGYMLTLECGHVRNVLKSDNKVIKCTKCWYMENC